MAITAEDIKKLSPRMKAVLVFFACLLVGYFYYFFYLQSALEKKGNLERKLSELKQDIQEKKKIAAQQSTYIRQLKKLKEDFKTALTKLPDKKEIPGLVESVSLEGRNSGIEFLLFEPVLAVPDKPDKGDKSKESKVKKEKSKQEPIKGEGEKEQSDEKFYVDIPIKVKVLGTFQNTLEFFDKISKLPRIINVEDLALSLNKEGKDKEGKDRKENEIITTGVIKTYMFLGNDSLEEKGSGDVRAKE